MGAAIRLHPSLFGLLWLLLILPGRCQAQSGVAVTSAADPGQVGLVVVLHHLAHEAEALIPAPVTRPGVGSRLVFGLLGGLDLHVEARFGLRLGMTPTADPEWAALAGLRLAPIPVGGPLRFELVAAGGMRSVPGNVVDHGGLWESDIRRTENPAVTVARLDSLVAIQPEPGKPAMLGRFRYENHWVVLASTVHSTASTQCRGATLASHLFEVRLGLLLSPEQKRSFIVECGLYFYRPEREDQMYPHTGLVLRLGTATELGPTAESPRSPAPEAPR